MDPKASAPKNAAKPVDDPVTTVAQNFEYLHVGSQPRVLHVVREVNRAGDRQNLGFHPILRCAFALTDQSIRSANEKYGSHFQGEYHGQQVRCPEWYTQVAYLESQAWRLMGSEACVASHGTRVLRSMRGVLRDFVPKTSMITAGVTLSEDSMELETACGHDPLLCDCGFPSHRYFGLDAGAYSPHAIAALIHRSQKGVGYAIVPKFTNIAGGLCNGKFQYFYHRPNVIQTTLAGESPRQMLDPLFIHGEQVAGSHEGHVHGGFFSLYSYRELETDDLVLWRLEMYSPGVGVETPPIHVSPLTSQPWVDLASAQISTTTAYSTLLGSGASSVSALTFAALKINEIRVFSTVIVYTTANDRLILFSRSIAMEGCRIFMNRPRTDLLLKTVTRWCIGQYDKLTALPSELKYDPQLATVVFIMSHGTASETALLATMLRDSAACWDTHASVLAFRAPYELTATKIISGLVYSGLTAYTAKAVGVSTYNTMATSNTVIASAITTKSLVFSHATVVVASTTAALHLPLVVPVWMFVTGVACAYNFLNKRRAPVDPLEEWKDTPGNEQAPPLPTGVYELSGEVRFSATECVKKTMPPQKLGSSVIVPSQPDISLPTFKMVLAGISFQEIPRYFENTAANQALALQDRLTRQTPPPVKGLWALIATLMMQHEFVVDCNKLFELPENFFVYNRRAVALYAGKFNLTMQRDLLEGYETFVRQGYRYYPENFKASGFGKGEKHVKPEIIAEEPTFAPKDSSMRGIISFPPLLNSTLGPYVDHATKIDKQYRTDALLDGYCPIAPVGVSGEVLGAWLDHMIERFGGPDNVVTVCEDSSRFDAHNGEESLEASVKMSTDPVHTNVPTLRQGFRAQHKIRGKTTKGVKFIVEFVKCSGASDTSRGNTKVSEAKTCYKMEPNEVAVNSIITSLTTFENLGRHYGIACCGDDVFIVANRPWVIENYRDLDNFRKELIRKGLRLGFEDDCKVYAGVDGDFCSRWWYPVNGGHLPGGKIGRVLAKAGYFFEASGEQTIRSAAIGSLQDNYHVPFLREYFETVCTITKKQGMKSAGRTNEHTIHMARRHAYDETTLDFVEAKYGLTRQDLVEFKALLSQVKRLPVVISWPHLYRCMAIDDA